MASPKSEIIKVCGMSRTHALELPIHTTQSFLPVLAKTAVMLKVETFIEGLALLRRQRGIESLRGGEPRFLLGDMFFGKSQHLFHAIRRGQTGP